MLNVIAPASMLAKGKRFATHGEWIRNISSQMARTGDLEVAWNGSIKGEPVKACIDSSRWVAFCPYCNGAEAVDPQEKIFFCFKCNMFDNDHAALPVEFPDARTIKKIVAVLMERPMKQAGGPTEYERITRLVPLIYIEVGGRRLGLGRAWHWSQSSDDLQLEQEDAIKAYKEQINGSV